jgi:hypothetical protein
VADVTDCRKGVFVVTVGEKEPHLVFCLGQEPGAKAGLGDNFRECLQGSVSCSQHVNANMFRMIDILVDFCHPLTGTCSYLRYSLTSRAMPRPSRNVECLPLI